MLKHVLPASYTTPLNSYSIAQKKLLVVIVMKWTLEFDYTTNYI